MARSKTKNVGLIGLGIIGSRVAGALRKRGLQVFVWNRTPRPEQNFVGSPAEVAELCDVVQIFVADDEALLEMVRQLSAGLTAHHIITAHCTVAPESMRAAAELVQRRGGRFLEAPFTGSKVAAENGQLVYYLSGDEAALKQVRPILEASSKEIVLISDRIGDASVMKVATNVVTAATAQVAAEALALVRRAGIPAELFSRAMKSNASNSTTIEMKAPLMIAGDFEPHFSVKHMLKDVRIGMKLAEEFSLDLPVTEVSGEMLLEEMKQGRGDADYASVAQRYFPVSKKIVRPEPEMPKPPEPAESPEPMPEVEEATANPVEPAAEAKEVAATPPTTPPPPPETTLHESKEAEPITPQAVESKTAKEKTDGPKEHEQESKTKGDDAPQDEPKPRGEDESKDDGVPAEEEEKPLEKERKEEEKAEEVPEGVNLSGGFRGWLSRFKSPSSRREF